MIVQIVLTVLLILYTAHILYSKFFKGSSGGCCCSKDGNSKRKCSK